MLVLSRHIDETIIIGDDVVLTVVETKGGAVRIGIQAPPHIPVHRGEVYEQIKACNVTRRDDGEGDWSHEPQGSHMEER